MDSELEEGEVPTISENPAVKKVVTKKRKKSLLLHKRLSSKESKPYNSCLPQSICDCTWIENCPSNIGILESKNNAIKQQREIKKEEALRVAEQNRISEKEPL